MVTAIWAGIFVLLLALAAEWLHARRVRRIAHLAFGPAGRPRAWTAVAPLARAGGLAMMAWGLTVLFVMDPKFHTPQEPPAHAQKRILIALDCSPSMDLPDAGDKRDEMRSKRAGRVLMSVLGRVSLEQARVTVVAFYSSAKPVVVDTKDPAVVKNIVDDLPLDYAFDPGKTQILGGIEEAFAIAKPWREKSTTFILISDGDTVPYTGMPAIPPAIAKCIVIGVGDSKVGKFIDGHQSRQAGMTLKQIATRLGGTYHDANDRNVPTQLINDITGLLPMKEDAAAGRREMAIAATGAGGTLVAMTPLALALFGTAYRPGRRVGAASVVTSSKSFEGAAHA
jgi:Ca-activated chloride channel family protein